MHVVLPGCCSDSWFKEQAGFASLLFRFMVERTRQINVWRSCFAALCLVSWIKERSIYSCSQSLFHVQRACFVGLLLWRVSTRGFKQASLELGPGGPQGFKNELCYVCTMLVSTHRFKNELCYMRSVFGSTPGFENELCYMCSVLVLTRGFKNKLCYMLSEPFSTLG